jgi:uncharacterized protein
MKINPDSIPFEGMLVEEDISAKELDLDIPEISLRGPLKARAVLSRITNAVHVELELSGEICLSCTRCLIEFRKPLEQHLRLDYAVEPRQREIDLDPDIREELIFGFQIKNLCKPDCKGLCVKCGANLNEGACACIMKE